MLTWNDQSSLWIKLQKHYFLVFKSWCCKLLTIWVIAGAAAINLQKKRDQSNFQTLLFYFLVSYSYSNASNASSGPPLRPNTASISSTYLYKDSRGFWYMITFPFSSMTNLVKFQGIFLIFPVYLLQKHSVLFLSFLKTGWADSPFTSHFFMIGKVAPIFSLAKLMISSSVWCSWARNWEQGKPTTWIPY